MDTVEARVPQVYFIIGADDGARRRHLSAIERALERAYGGTCDHVSLDADEVSADRVGEVIETTPLFPGPRLVVMRRLEGASADLLDYLAERLPPPSPQTAVVFLAATVDRRRQPIANLLARSEVLPADPPTGQDLPAWVAEQAHALGLRLDRRAVDALLMWVGEEPIALRTELEKLALWSEPGQLLDAETVTALVSRSLPAAGDSAVFELVDAVVAGNRGKALTLLDRLIAAGKPPLVLLSMLARQYRTLTAACGRPDLGPDGLAKTIGLRPFAARKAMQQARQMSLREAIAGLEAILEADYRLKSGWNDRLTLEMLIGRLTGSRRPANTFTPKR